ncbi:hypothetical protein CDD81_6735 [Ophiocordyceps australis]|uniref:Defect at low temperature protein 1 n=1 Tax=Ophiocordyceps australis TaxID=1399860 RepID=A0A2C5Y236_9HYPO|nr:hypothetical protein CDD81_6735 [Ophiocordyceps australis]
MAYQRFVSRMAYAAIYLIFYVILIGLLLITPGDAINRSVRNKQTYNIWIITVAYVVTAMVVCSVFALRLYVNKTALASIPKTGGVTIAQGAVHEAVEAGLDASARVACDAQPRLGRQTTQRAWMAIEHAGYAPPSSAQSAEVRYRDVVLELGNLLEARIVQTGLGVPGLPALLQRQPQMSLRHYLAHLAVLGVVEADKTTADFVALYEYARFANRPISHARFTNLLRLFALVMRRVQRASTPEAGEAEESDIDDNAPLASGPQSRSSRESLESGAWSGGASSVIINQVSR